MHETKNYTLQRTSIASGTSLMLILCSAVLSAMFAITKLNEQLMVSSVETRLYSATDAAKATENDAIKKINAEDAELKGQQKRLDDELLHLNFELKQADIDKEREVAAIKSNYRKQEFAEKEQLDICDSNCAIIQSKLDSISRKKQAEINDITLKYKAEKQEILAKINNAKDKLASISKEHKENETRVSQEKDNYETYESDATAKTDEYLRKQKSFGALLLYMRDGDSGGKFVSITVFVILLIFL